MSENRRRFTLNEPSRRALRAAAGLILAVGCTTYVVSQCRKSAELISLSELRPGLWSAAAVGCLAAGQVLIGTMTYLLLPRAGNQPRWRHVITVHVVTQLAKYLPAGSVLNAAAQTWGLGRLPGVRPMSAASTVANMVLMTCAGAACTYGLARGVAHGRLSWEVVASVLALPAAAVFSVTGWHRFNRWVRRGTSKVAEPEAPAASRARTAVTLAGLALLSWAVLGCGVAALAADLLPITGSQTLLLIGAFALSWLVGFVSLIAPAGLGVREVSFMLLLQPFLAPPWPQLLPILSRVAWVVADLLNALLAWLLFRPRGPAADPARTVAAQRDQAPDPQSSCSSTPT